jgi:hypothetical protein
MLGGGFMKEVLNGFHRLNMILIGWIVYYICIRRGYMLVSNDLLKQNERQKHCRKRAAALIINKYIQVDTVEALNIIVDSFIDQSTSCFMLLWSIFTSYCLPP